MAMWPNLLNLNFLGFRLRGGETFHARVFTLGVSGQPASSELQIVQDFEGLWGLPLLKSVSWLPSKDHPDSVPSPQF